MRMNSPCSPRLLLNRRGANHRPPGLRRGPVSLTLALCCALLACSSTEQYGFVAELGRDTLSVEHITRSPGKLIADGVDRFPLVRQRHTEIDLGPDGRLTHMVMDVRTPSGATPAERGRRVVADFTNDSVHVVITDSAGITQRSFATGSLLTVPHVSMMYSVIELEIAFALRHAAATGMKAGESVVFRQFYPDRDIGPRFVLHRGYVKVPAGDSVELRHDWLAGYGDVKVDSVGRMLSYSGARSTYKVAVQRITTRPDISSIAAAFAAREREAGASQLSVRDTARGSIGGVTISVDYGRPLARGRVLLGNVIPYARVWRTGANEATHMTITSPLRVGTLTLPAGTYTLWTMPRPDGAELIVNSQTGQWGTGYNRTHDVGRVAMSVGSPTAPVETFTIAIVPGSAGNGELVMEWGNFRWSVHLEAAALARAR